LTPSLVTAGRVGGPHGRDGSFYVRRVLDGPSCDLIEVDDGTLVPFVADAVATVDPGARRIEVRREFIG
jgi:hypothetical protein